MKLNRLFASMLILAASASTSFAAGAVSMTWSTCIGPVNIVPTPGGLLDGYVSVLGQTTVTTAHQCVTLGGSVGGPIADAWRFDAAGCESPSNGSPPGLFVAQPFAQTSVSKACPALQGSAPGLALPDYSYDITTGKVKITLANAYPNPDANGTPQGNAAGIDPTKHYCIANYHFNMAFAVNGPSNPADACGGLDIPVCFALTSASWLDLNSAEIPWAVAGGFLTSSDANNAQHCPGVVPAQPTTWGKVKGQYR